MGPAQRKAFFFGYLGELLLGRLLNSVLTLLVNDHAFIAVVCISVDQLIGHSTVSNY